MTKMKRYIKTIFAALLFSSITACNYLDINPEQGIPEEDVFSSYRNAKAFFDTVYEGKYNNSAKSNMNLKLAYPMYIDFTDLRFSFYCMTDAADCGRLVRSQAIKMGNLGANTIDYLTITWTRRPIVDCMFRLIRICNKTIENIDLLNNAKPNEKADLLGQAYFVRAYCHFNLVRYFGGMPYVDKVLTAADNWDMTRLPAGETLRLCAQDFDLAHDYMKEAGKMRRDGKPGQAGHLEGSELGRPNGVAAKALKARVLLYAASPLNNINGQADWEDAAAACAEAISIAEEWGYAMVPAEEWKTNYYGPAYTNELVWSYSYRSEMNHNVWAGTFAFPQSNYSNAGGTCPTQNFVDKFETKEGYPLNTEEDRARAVSLGLYNEQDPYSNRDPRFDDTIIHDGSVVTGSSSINIHYDPANKSYPTTDLSGQKREFGIAWGTNDGKGYSNTGYYLNKRWNGIAASTSNKIYQSDPLIRMAELYLNYAEAVNEAYGPNGRAGEVSLSAVEAVNKVRNRVNMPDMLTEYTADTDKFRERLRNERNVELAFEGHHYYFDIRRWMTAPESMTQVMMGMYIEKVPVSAEYPKGRKYVRTPMPANRQSAWKSAMYYIPFPISEANKMQNFVNNELW